MLSSYYRFNPIAVFAFLRLRQELFVSFVKIEILIITVSVGLTIATSGERSIGMDVFLMLILALVFLGVISMIYISLHIPRDYFGIDTLKKGRGLFYSFVLANCFYVFPSCLRSYDVIEFNIVSLLFFTPVVILFFYIVFAIYKNGVNNE
jgi:hypothetical protein